MRFDFGPDLGDDGLHPGPLVIAGTMLGSVQAEQQGDMRIRYRVVQERPRVEQGGEALQGLAVQNVDGLSISTTACWTSSSGCSANIWMRPSS